MSILISGSLAFDMLFEFDGEFAQHILPEQIDRLSVAFLTPRMRRDFGGCAANIAYAVRQLGSEAMPLASIGHDGAHYIERLRGWGARTELIATVADEHTAQCAIVTDTRQNQITAFHPGAMAHAHLNPVPADVVQRGVRLAIVAPNGKQAMIEHAAQLHAAGIAFVFDPGQGLPMFNADEIDLLITQAHWLALNGYESHMLCAALGCDLSTLSLRVDGLIVTRSGDGCEIWEQGRMVRIPAEHASAVIDPTGCGDAWRGALLHGLSQGWDLPRCARLGNHMGAVKVAQRGPQNYRIDPEIVARY